MENFNSRSSKMETYGNSYVCCYHGIWLFIDIQNNSYVGYLIDIEGRLLGHAYYGKTLENVFNNLSENISYDSYLKLVNKK